MTQSMPNEKHLMKYFRVYTMFQGNEIGTVVSAKNKKHAQSFIGVKATRIVQIGSKKIA